MDSPQISTIKAAIDALQVVVYWYEPGRKDFGRQADAALEAQRAIEDLVKSNALQKLKVSALTERKIAFKQRQQND